LKGKPLFPEFKIKGGYKKSKKPWRFMGNDMYICFSCREWIVKEEFPPDKRYSKGFRPVCIHCEKGIKERDRKYRERNKQRWIENYVIEVDIHRECLGKKREEEILIKENGVVVVE